MADIYDIQKIKQRIERRFQTNPKIHINVALTQPKLHLDNVEVTITGVFSHIFQIEEMDNGQPQRHTLQYSDILLHHIDILDLD